MLSTETYAFLQMQKKVEKKKIIILQKVGLSKASIGLKLQILVAMDDEREYGLGTSTEVVHHEGFHGPRKWEQIQG